MISQIVFTTKSGGHQFHSTQFIINQIYQRHLELPKKNFVIHVFSSFKEI